MVGTEFWHHQNESMDTTCHVSTIQAGGCSVNVWGIIYWHTFHQLIQIENCLNATSYHIGADHMHLFMTTIFPSYNGYFKHDNLPEALQAKSHLKLGP